MSTGCWTACCSVTKLTREVDRLGSTAARLKLKGIDGDPHKRWMMWFNSMQREKPYLPLTCQEFCRDRKSTRLNSSHVKNSYAVFCLKKTTPRTADVKYKALRKIPGYQNAKMLSPG